MTSPEAHTLTGAYALDAVEARDRAEVEAHLAVCPSCAREVRELRAVAEILGGAVLGTPPAGLRERVLREINGTRQLPPLVTDLDRERRERRRLRLLTVAASAAAVIAFAALGAVGAVAIDQRGELADVRAQVESLDSVLAAAAATSARPMAGGGQMAVLELGGKAFVDMRDLPNLEDGRVYQLWMADESGVHSAGTIDGKANRAARLIEISRNVVSMKVTIEPAGGSAQPTSPELVDVPIQRAGG
ncbi:MAG: anti-sigma factor [Frankia sp.]|nr:anti-sigma factor [Frankia sp.]